MSLRILLGQLRGLWSLQTDNPELLKAQCAALSRMIPMMYIMLVVNGLMMSSAFFHTAPRWLTVYTTGALALICGVRLVVWWRMRDEAITLELATRELRRTYRLSGVLGLVFVGWSLALFPYGDAAARFHVVLFITVSMIGSMICLLHLRQAAFNVLLLAGGGFTAFAVMTGDPNYVAVAVNVMVVSATLLVIILLQNRDFAHMVNSRTEARQREQEQGRLMRMINDMPVAVMTVEPDTLNIDYANEASRQVIRRIEHLLPIEVDSLIGTSIDVFHRHPEHQRRILADPANLPHSARIHLGPEVLDLRVSAVTGDDGGYLGPMLTWAIVTKEVEAERRIHQLAHYDVLTGLANRNTFHEELEARLAAGSGAALLFIDLDGFKLVNDTKGHRVGDALLRQVAERLQARCSLPGMAVGRLGGDEFAVLVPNSDATLASATAQGVIEALSDLYRLEDDRQVRLGASIGVALSPQHGDDAGILLARADMALYAAKAAGKSTFRLFEPEMEARVQEQVRLEAKLRDALDEGEGLFVFYQPIVDIDSGRVMAREALVRWRHPQRGWIAPSEFVPVAEESGLIDRLGLFVLNRACRDAAAWADGARVAVNVSAGQLGKNALPEAVLEALVASGLSPDRLEVEVTETALLSGEQGAICDLRRLRAMGVRVALDDFGTGYSSLAHLRAFPFDKIKIDGSFVKDALERPDCAAVVRAIAELGKRLGVATVAEGVETKAHLDRIVEEGCSLAQGYYFGRPAPSDGDAALIAALDRMPARVSAA